MRTHGCLLAPCDKAQSRGKQPWGDTPFQIRLPLWFQPVLLEPGLPFMLMVNLCRIIKIQTIQFSFLCRQQQQQRAERTPGLKKGKKFASGDSKSILFMGLVLSFLSELAAVECIPQKFHSSVSQTWSLASSLSHCGLAHAWLSSIWVIISHRPQYHRVRCVFCTKKVEYRQYGITFSYWHSSYVGFATFNMHIGFFCFPHIISTSACGRRIRPRGHFSTISASVLLGERQ